jgi:hypothetical protein
MDLHKTRRVGRLVDYLMIAFLGDLAFAVPCLILLLGFGLMPPLLAVFIFTPSFLLKSPINGVMGWLMAKGGNIEGLALKTIGAIPGMYYGFLLGGFVGAEIFKFNQTGAIVFLLLFYAIGLWGGMLLGPLIGRKILGKVN